MRGWTADSTASSGRCDISTLAYHCDAGPYCRCERHMWVSMGRCVGIRYWDASASKNVCQTQYPSCWKPRLFLWFVLKANILNSWEQFKKMLFSLARFVFYLLQKIIMMILAYFQILNWFPYPNLFVEILSWEQLKQQKIKLLKE